MRVSAQALLVCGCSAPGLSQNYASRFLTPLWSTAYKTVEAFEVGRMPGSSVGVADLSTQLNPETIPPQSVDSDEALAFSELVQRLNDQTSPPALEDLQSWLANVAITPEDLEPYVAFKEGNYWRHRVCRNPAVEMLVLCWRPGHKTPIHDHNGSVGAVRVQAGLLSETMFQYDEVKGLSFESARKWNVGGVTGADLADIHQLGNSEDSGQDLVTIHIYAPPLSVIKTYKLGSPEIDLYTPDDSGA